MTFEEKKIAFYKKLGITSMKKVFKIIKKPCAFKPFNIGDSEYWREPKSNYKSKKHTGR